MCAFTSFVNASCDRCKWDHFRVKNFNNYCCIFPFFVSCRFTNPRKIQITFLTLCVSMFLVIYRRESFIAVIIRVTFTPEKKWDCSHLHVQKSFVFFWWKLEMENVTHQKKLIPLILIVTLASICLGCSYIIPFLGLFLEISTFGKNKDTCKWCFFLFDILTVYSHFLDVYCNPK